MTDSSDATDKQSRLLLSKKIGAMERAGMLDEESGLYNRSHFLELGQAEFRRAQRYGLQLTLVMVTVSGDNLSSDQIRHTISWTSQVCFGSCRAGIDIVGRVAPRTVAIFLPQTSLSGGFAFVDRLQTNITNVPVMLPSGQTLRPAITLSTDAIRDNDSSFADLFRRIDAQPNSSAA